MPEKHEIDQQAAELLERALGRYAGEPLAGLEKRTLARLRSEQETMAARFFNRARLRRWIAVATAGAATVAASLVIGIQVGQHRADAVWQQRLANASGIWNSVGPAGKVAITAAAPTESSRPPAVHAVHVARRHTARAAATRAGKAAQFPSPAPLTPQERSLAGLAATADPATLSSLARTMQSENSSFADYVRQHSEPDVRPPQ
ncbi:MAG TPA: hypothetical protein VE998_01710 [Terriglobales bacterium]|nr:hypothetical protein [Terriglobales bacterium]